jgi:hypothetical protein
MSTTCSIHRWKEPAGNDAGGRDARLAQPRQDSGAMDFEISSQLDF